MQMDFNTPVLFLLFNRMDEALRVFAEIKKAKPPRLYLAADGPRDHVPGEKEKCERVRGEIQKAVDWDCRVETLFRRENLGCKEAVSSALDWFFEHEAEGIILEDDCLPASSFFNYCGQLLERYREDNRIGIIAGTSFTVRNIPESYYFSNLAYIWGWATWRRVWRLRDMKMADWPDIRVQQPLFPFLDRRASTFYRDMLDRFYERNSVWDFPFQLSLWRHGLKSIIPKQNMVVNIGMGVTSTHTKHRFGLYKERSANDALFPLIHPGTVSLGEDFDRDFFEKTLRHVPRYWLAQMPAVLKTILKKVGI